MELAPLEPTHIAGCLDVVRTLPEWFGYPNALEGIERALRVDEGFVVLEDGQVRAFVATARRYEETVEIDYLAVHRDDRRRGYGRALVAAVRDATAAAGAGLIVLLTLGPSAESPYYAETVRFYQAVGFARTKELHITEWGGAPTLVMSTRVSDLSADHDTP